MNSARKLRAIFLFTLFSFVIPSLCWGLDYKKRLGIGYSNQLTNDIQALSFKYQPSRTFAWGGIAGLNTQDSGGGYGAGLKAYRLFFEEPQLNFYGAVMGAFINQKSSATESESGFQVDFTLGGEFAFPQVNSLGFSFEFGMSLYKIDDFAFQTVGNNFLVAGVHFYL